jgi:soluble lytic murein transglycosylase-like protein
VRRRGLRATALALVGLCALAPAGAARGGEVRLPIPLDVALLRHLIESRVFEGPGGVARVWDDGTGCNRLDLRRPEVSMQGDRLRVTAEVEAHVGTPAFGSCLFAFAWNGGLEAFETARLDAEHARVSFRVVDSNLLEPDGSKALTRGVLWDWIKAYVHPRLEAVTVELSDTLETLRGLLPLFLSGAPPDTVSAIVDSIALVDLRPTGSGYEVWLRFELPPAPPAPRRSGPEPPLTAEELARFEAAAQRFDAFLTFVVKRAGGEASDTTVRRDLRVVLLDGRQELVDALARPEPEGPDPVRQVFLHTWVRLAPVLRRIGNTVPGEGGLRYLSLVTAADALRALDALGPSGGFEISSDGLRRLARVVAPASSEDPLVYGTEVDPELRGVLGFGPPLPAPETSPEEPGGAPAPSAPAPAPETAPQPPPSPEPPSSPAPPPPPPAPAPPAPSAPAPSSSGLWRALRRALAQGGWNPFAVEAARAAEAGAPPGIPRAALRRLDHWVPSAEDLDEYLALMRNLLRAVASERVAASSLEPRYRALYTPLVLATAWQETCWRQFVRSGGRIRAIRSRAGAVGLMQVNARVWRGFYGVPFLERDVAYNARAGAEILMHYLADEVLERVGSLPHDEAGDIARATYATYNGGPRALRRWLDPGASRRERRVDDAFFQKFQAVSAGRELGVAACFGRGGEAVR